MLIIGQIVYCGLYGGKYGHISGIHGEQKPNTIENLAGGVVMGGSASFDVIWDDGSSSRGIPESIIHGVQWRILDNVLDGAAMLEAEIKKAQYEFGVAFCKEYDANKYNLEVERIKKEYPYLIVNPPSGAVGAAKNIRTELKLAFPKTKFSVRADRYTSVDIRWTDGPTDKEVEEIANKYEAGSFDGMEDIYRYSSSAWHIFGSVKYVFTHRETVKVKERALKIYEAVYGEPLEDRYEYHAGRRYSEIENALSEYSTKKPHISKDPAEGFAVKYTGGIISYHKTMPEAIAAATA